jgi:metal-dependent amidase/aminoacylase/carboxypeptidase family protein
MMVHPMSSDDLDHMPCLAIQDFEVHYHGKTAHASAYPELGLNAADALTVAQTAIGLLRQHIKHTDRIHGIVLHGGDAPNVVPHETSGRWYVRAKNLKQLAELEPRVVRCFEAGALATGCTVDVEKAGPPYSEFEHDKGLAAFYRSNAESRGRKFADLPEEVAQKFAGSTDMANISLAMPSIHRCSGSTASRRRTTSPSSPACITPKADQAVVDGRSRWPGRHRRGDGLATRARLLAGVRA